MSGQLLLPTVLLGFFVQAGCGKALQDLGLQAKPAPTKSLATMKPPANRAPVHRFTLTRGDGGVAFDTQTGQICKTWEWVPVGKTPTEDTNAGGRQRIFGEFAPTCLSLYTIYPTGSSDNFEFIPDDTSTTPQ